MSTAAGLPTPTVRTQRLDALLADVSAERMTTTVTTLAGDGFTGRRIGTAGGAAARTWLIDHLTTMGATPTTEEFPVRSVPEIYRRPTADWDRTALVFGRDVAVHLASADLSAPRTGALGVAGTHDPADRWLVVPPGMSLFDAYGHGYRAAGLLLPRAVDDDGWQYTMLAGPNPGPLPILTVETELHRRLLHAARVGGGTLTADAPVRRRDVTGTNIHARLRPAAPGRPDLLLTAHYDGVGDHPGLRQPAAADNASGVAVVCEAARLLAPNLPDGTGLALALVDGEETGALGSAHHAANLPADGAPWVVNVDGAGCLHTAAAVEAGGPAHGLLAVLDQAGRHVDLPLAPGPVASDNRRYAAAGFAAVGIGAGMAGYHSPADTPERVEPTTLTAIARLVIAACWFAGATATG